VEQEPTTTVETPCLLPRLYGIIALTCASAWVVIIVLLLGFGLSSIDIRREWHERSNEKRKFRYGKVVLTTLSLATGIGLVFFTARETDSTAQANAQPTASLQGAVDNQTKNDQVQYDRNQAELGKIQDQLADLKTQVATEELRKKITTLEGQLDKSLAPAPKASLQLTFFPTGPAPDGVPSPVTDIILPVGDEGVVHVEFRIINSTTVDAVDGAYNVRICDGRKFAKEPTGFSRLPGAPDTERNAPIQRVLARSVTEMRSIDVTVPSAFHDFDLAFTYRCHTCAIEGLQNLKVRLRRDTIRLPAH
jgi:hypothetical protein